MIEDHWAHLARARMADLHRESAAHRLARGCPGRLHAVYARLWWAARPRAGTWAPRLLQH
ncbi:hypothetical protein [Pseudonocardia sp. ICBG1293]|uniref:hypothetical protein n=1 Tax=Pseudonocardia sp. ICBG1293 TaxID=2844382 RepID=UPI001CCC9C99|nr:hypothetical protein [Pseudonocardia sp. ICBG1293]